MKNIHEKREYYNLIKINKKPRSKETKKIIKNKFIEINNLLDLCPKTLPNCLVSKKTGKKYLEDNETNYKILKDGSIIYFNKKTRDQYTCSSSCKKFKKITELRKEIEKIQSKHSIKRKDFDYCE